MALLGHLLLLLSLFLPFCACADYIGYTCVPSFNGTDSQIANMTNINQVLSDLIAGATVSGFANSSFGTGNDKVYGLAQCRGDVSAGNCSACVTAAAKELPVGCQNQTGAKIWYDYCFVRYDTKDFFGVFDNGTFLTSTKGENATDLVAYENKVTELMTELKAESVVPANKGLGRGTAQFSTNVTIYGLTQCTEDLTPSTCADCLTSAVEEFPDYCKFRTGCQVLYSSCTVQYGVDPFFTLESNQT